MRIVLTGGPSAGKTTIAESLVRAYWNRLIIVPEGASILFRGGFPRDDAPEALTCQQRAIYHVQSELEELKSLERADRALICDRGTLDGLAYWPLSEAEFFDHVKSSMTAELCRYDWVIHLDTASQDSYQPSTIRKETFNEARLINEKIKFAWRKHPRLLLVNNHKDFSAKITNVLLGVKMILDGQSEQRIRDFFAK